MENPAETPSHEQAAAAPAGTASYVVPDKTLPDLMYDSMARYANPRLLNQPLGDGSWKPFSSDDFRRHSEEVAVGLAALGLGHGDRMAFYMESDVYFCIMDMGCLIAGVVDVPIYLSHGRTQILHVVSHSGAKALAVSNADRLEEVRDLLAECPSVQTVVVADDDGMEDGSLPEGVQVHTLAGLRDLGRRRMHGDGQVLPTLRDRIGPEDMATIIYTSGTTGSPKGVMLSHANLVFDAISSFGEMPGYQRGPDGEVGLSFLPLTHIFARMMHYGFVYHGTSVYFSHPDTLVRDLGIVRPTLFATVPRVLEKVVDAVRARIAQTKGLQRTLASWALSVGERYDLLTPPGGFYAVQRALADRILFHRWRTLLGGRVRYLIAGGAALVKQLADLFGAAGIPILQGYGLTETSPVISFNRLAHNRPGTVGQAIPGVEVKIAEDGEILTRGPHVMQGYYRDEEETKKVIDEQGWLHTGDVGELSEDGFLRITDRKKDLFKLSTGKYVTPQPLENKLRTYPLIEEVMVLGNGRKHCAALLFPSEEGVRAHARTRGLSGDDPLNRLVMESVLQDQFREYVEEANEQVDPWSRIKRFRILVAELTPENGLRTPTMKVRRRRVHDAFASEIEEIYQEGGVSDAVVVVERREHAH